MWFPLTISHLAPVSCTKLLVPLLGVPWDPEHEAEMINMWGCWQALNKDYMEKRLVRLSVLLLVQVFMNASANDPFHIAIGKFGMKIMVHKKRRHIGFLVFILICGSFSLTMFMSKIPGLWHTHNEHLRRDKSVRILSQYIQDYKLWPTLCFENDLTSSNL